MFSYFSLVNDLDRIVRLVKTKTHHPLESLCHHVTQSLHIPPPLQQTNKVKLV